jgi:hypothetical protein
LEDYPENFWITSYLSGLSRNFQYKKLLCCLGYWWGRSESLPVIAEACPL